MNEPALTARGIRKAFPGVAANDGVDFDLAVGEVHALLGQNGAGKTTLVNILCGRWRPDAGRLWVHGRAVTLRSPLDARRAGVAVVHQHFTLAGALTVAENVSLAAPPRLFLPARARRDLLALAECYGFAVDPDSPVETLSTGARQRVEILKALATGARILLLDEPTSVLAPNEVQRLFRDLRALAANGYAILLITHKIDEALAVSDRVSAMRAGRVVATRPVSEVSRNDLIEWVVGRDVPEAAACARSGAPGEEVALQVRDLAVDGDLKPDACADVDLEVRRGEILCILGVAGNGQQELAQAVMGLRRRRRGVVRLFGEAAPPLAPWWMIERGAGYVPCDETGLVLAMRCAENLVIKDFWRKPFSRLGFLCCRLIEDRSQGLVRRHGIASHNPYLSTRHLSGGNRQKLVLAREFSRGPRVIIADQPTRGLDVVAAEETRRWLVSVANGEGAVLWITTECDEAMAVADRISVMVRGRLIRPVARSEADATALGLLMSGVEAKAGSVP